MSGVISRHTKTLFSKPLLHLFILGGLLYFLILLFDVLSSGNDLHDRAIVIEEYRVAAIKKQWHQRYGRVPDTLQLKAAIVAEENDELLFREALHRDLHLTDPIVRQRLLKDLDFLGFSSKQTEPLRFKTAIELELYRHDLVIKRRLVQLMGFALFDSLDKLAFSEQELLAYYQDNKQLWNKQARYSFKQVFFAKQEQANAYWEKNKYTAITAEEGEYFQLGNHFSAVSAQQLTNSFGIEFVNHLSECGSGEWLAPIRSVYGYHLVFIDARSKSGTLTFAQARKQVVEKLFLQRRKTLLKTALVQLRQRYGMPS